MSEQPLWNEQSLASALSGARERYMQRNPASGELYARAKAVMPGGNTRTALHFDPFPLYISTSRGAYIEDADGHTYLDVLGEYTAGLYGHTHPAIIEEIKATADRGMSNGAPGEGEIALAEAMRERFPSIDVIRFCNSGTEANLYALTLAKIVTGRDAILVFSGAYHGGVLAFGGGTSPMNVPFDWVVMPYNHRDIGQVIQELGPRLAAVIVEPMLSNGGCIAADPHFLKEIRRATEQSGVLLILDEVVTSRMGASGLQGKLGIDPDLTTFGKYIGAGFSFGAFGGREDIMARFDPSHPQALGHAGTFNNNVFSMKVGNRALREVFTSERAEELYDQGEWLRQRLNALAAELCPVVQFTGCGSVMNIHFIRGEIRSPGDLTSENKDLIQLFHFDLLAAGIYAARRGQINLSLPMNDADLQKIVAAVAAFLEDRKSIIEAAA